MPDLRVVDVIVHHGIDLGTPIPPSLRVADDTLSSTAGTTPRIGQICVNVASGPQLTIGHVIRSEQGLMLAGPQAPLWSTCAPPSLFASGSETRKSVRFSGASFLLSFRFAVKGRGICNRLWTRPSLLNQKGQVVYPIVFTDPARIDHVGQIVFGVRENKIGVRNRIVAVTRPCFVGRRNPRSLLNRLESSFGSREADKMFIEIVEPPAQFRPACPVRDRW